MFALKLAGLIVLTNALGLAIYRAAARRESRDGGDGILRG